MRTKVVAGGAAGAAIVALFLVTGGRSCSSREDIEARVGATSAALQQAAAQGKLQVSQLANGVKRLNAASTAYETNKDAAAFCEALDTLTADLQLGP